MISVRHGALSGATQALMFTSDAMPLTETLTLAFPLLSVTVVPGAIVAEPVFSRKLIVFPSAGTPFATTVAVIGTVADIPAPTFTD